MLVTEHCTGQADTGPGPWSPTRETWSPHTGHTAHPGHTSTGPGLFPLLWWCVGSAERELDKTSIRDCHRNFFTLFHSHHIYEQFCFFKIKGISNKNLCWALCIANGCCIRLDGRYMTEVSATLRRNPERVTGHTRTDISSDSSPPPSLQLV